MILLIITLLIFHILSFTIMIPIDKALAISKEMKNGAIDMGIFHLLSMELALINL